MTVLTLHHQTRGVQGRSRTGRLLKRRAIAVVRTVGDRICDGIDEGFRWLVAPEPWLLGAEWGHLGLFEEPTPDCRSQAHRRRYCALIMDANGNGERTCEFEDSPTLLDGPADSAARAVLDRLAAVGPTDKPFPYRIQKASRHGDFLMVQGVLGDGEWEFLAFASAA
jgi:hypothetical protein